MTLPLPDLENTNIPFGFVPHIEIFRMRSIRIGEMFLRAFSTRAKHALLSSNYSLTGKSLCRIETSQ
jgi:hypothetical protein